MENIKKGKLKFPSYMSLEARHLIKWLLNKKPEKRPTISEIKSHQFFRQTNWAKLAKKQEVPPQKLQRIEDEESDFSDEEAAMIFKEEEEKLGVEDVDYTEENKNLNRLKNVSFVKKGAILID